MEIRNYMLTGCACESSPNKPIIADITQGPHVVVEPGALGRLASARITKLNSSIAINIDSRREQ